MTLPASKSGGKGKAFIHIGMEKTGTTAVQEFLTRNEMALQAQGFTYLGDEAAPYFSRIGHFPVAACFYDTIPDFIPPDKFRPQSEVLDSLRAASQATSHDIILSCELFSSRLDRAESLKALRDALPGRDITIICYLRRQDRQCLSAYSTIVRYGRTELFDPTDITPQSRYYNYEWILSLWGDVFGDRNVILREFDRGSLVGGDIQQDFLALLGLRDDGFEPAGEPNTSLDSRQVEMLRRINAHLTSYSRDVDPQAFRESNAIRAVLFDLLPEGAPISALLSDQESADIMARFAATNAALARRFGAEFAAAWHSGTATRPENGPPSEVSAEDFAQMAAACGARILRQNTRLAELTAGFEERGRALDDCLRNAESQARQIEERDREVVSLRKKTSTLWRAMKFGFLRQFRGKN